ncbi:MAG: hypothetical protein Q7J34_14265 [Bacteroidales bacterium]|nr:hypothetical protein [Bacteroidales bacterium]
MLSIPAVVMLSEAKHLCCHSERSEASISSAQRASARHTLF